MRGEGREKMREDTRKDNLRGRQAEKLKKLETNPYSSS